jgi:hypothetical protein
VKDKPSADDFHKLVWTMPTCKVADKFGVSDKAVEKWCKKLGVQKPPRGYWNKVQAKLVKVAQLVERENEPFLAHVRPVPFT